MPPFELLAHGGAGERQVEGVFFGGKDPAGGREFLGFEAQVGGAEGAAVAV